MPEGDEEQTPSTHTLPLVHAGMHTGAGFPPEEDEPLEPLDVEPEPLDVAFPPAPPFPPLPVVAGSGELHAAHRTEMANKEEMVRGRFMK